jgi:hypothetical protein
MSRGTIVLVSLMLLMNLSLLGCRDAGEMDKENTRHMFDKRNERLHEAVPSDTCHDVAIMVEGEGKVICPSGTWFSTWHQMSPTLLAVQCKCFMAPGTPTSK